MINLFKDNSNIILLVLLSISIIYNMYYKIKFICLEKASEMISLAEGRTDLKGIEKFTLCVNWILNDLPKLFRNSLIKTMAENLIQYVYDNCFDFAKKYFKRKTGVDLNDILKITTSKNTISINLDKEFKNASKK